MKITIIIEGIEYGWSLYSVEKWETIENQRGF